MSETPAESNQHRTEQKDRKKSAKTVNSPSVLSPESFSPEESLVTFSESLFFPTSSDAIWQSAAILSHDLLDEDVLFSDEHTDDEANKSPDAESSHHFFDGETSEDDDFEGNQAQLNNGEDEPVENETDRDEPTQDMKPFPYETVSSQQQVSMTEDLGQLPESSGTTLPAVTVTAQHEEEPLQAEVAVNVPSSCHRDRGLVSLFPHRVIAGKDKLSPQLTGLYEQMTRLSLPGPDASVEELEEKFDSGLRLLDDLVHANTSDEKELKDIYDAYYNFARTLFEDIKEPSRLMRRSKLESDGCDVDLDSLEEQKNKIAEQERLLENEILHYKATKRELKEIAQNIEEASKSYRKPEILEDVVIPKDIKLSSSSEYVAEIEELQEEILKKQDTLKDIRKEIQHRLLPKSLVDSVCESHRLAMQSLRDIEEETAYLKECISRLDLKYLYNLQIS